MNTRNFKTLVTIFVMGIFVLNTSAQANKTNYDQGFRLGFGISGGIPTNKAYDFNLGADARLQYDLTRDYSLTFTTGFSNMFIKGDNNDLGYIPAKIGFKAFVLEDQLYLMGEVGSAFAVTNNYNKTSLILSPTIGYATKSIDFSLRYEHFSDFQTINADNSIGKGLGLISLRLAYGFKL